MTGHSKFGAELHALVSAAHIANKSDVEAIGDMIAQLASNLGGIIGFSTGGDVAKATALAEGVKSYLDDEIERALLIRAANKSRREARQ